MSQVPTGDERSNAGAIAGAADELQMGSSAKEVLSKAQSFLNTVEKLRGDSERLQQRARYQHKQLHQRVVAEQLGQMPLEKLRDATASRLKLNPLNKAGLRSVLDVATASSEWLRQAPGIGEKTAEAARAAAHKIRETLVRQTAFRFDPDNQDHQQTVLLGTLRACQIADQALSELGNQFGSLTTQVDTLIRQSRPTKSSVRMFFARRRKKDAALRALRQLTTLLDDPRVELAHAGLERVQQALAKQNPGALWRDYQQRAATYNTLLAQIIGMSRASEGMPVSSVSAEVEREVSQRSLNTSLLRVQLRGYQVFGAKYALARKRSMVGDEMGLGKTIEALAAMADLAERGNEHFLVVCPAGVLLNWIDETSRHSALIPHRLHGPQRDRALQSWRSGGGVAVTTYSTMQLLPDLRDARIDMLVVDEAHYVKHPDRNRSRAIAKVSNRAERVLFLTGTPMENRLKEFKNLVSYLQPEIAERVSTEDALMGPEAFRKTVATVYLRRNNKTYSPNFPRRSSETSGSNSARPTPNAIEQQSPRRTSWPSAERRTRLAR